MNKIPVMIDCDPGIDDTLAIIMLAGSEKVKIKAITSTHGNVGLEGTTRNALALKDFLGLDCVVAKGASKPMIVSQKAASTVHGLNGLGNYDIPAPVSKAETAPAWDVMYSHAKKLKPMMDRFQRHDKIWMQSECDRLGLDFDYDTSITTKYDSTAAAALLMDGDGLETEDYYVICETQGSETEGQNIFDYSGRFGKQPNVSVVVKMDREKYHSLIRNALARFE